MSLLVVYALRKYIGEYIEGSDPSRPPCCSYAEASFSHRRDINFEWTDSVRLGPLSVNAEALNREFELSGLFCIQKGCNLVFSFF